MTRTYVVIFQNYRKPFPLKWRQIIWKSNQLEWSEQKGDENGPYFVAQFAEYYQMCDVIDGFSTQDVRIPGPTIQTRTSADRSFNEVLKDIENDRYDAIFESDLPLCSKPLADAAIRWNAQENQ